MQNKKYPVQTWDTSNQTDRRKEGEDFPKHHYFYQDEGHSQAGTFRCRQGADQSGYKQLDFAMSLSSREQAEASR